MTNSIVNKIKMNWNWNELSSFGVGHLWLFGSAIKVDRDANDVDILVEFVNFFSRISWKRAIALFSIWGSFPWDIFHKLNQEGL